MFKNKKILISLVTVILCSLLLTGCGNKTKLTIENYEKYLDVYVTSNCSENTLKDSCTVSLYVKGKSENFNYNDVEVTTNIKGTYKKYKRLGNTSFDPQGEETFNLENINSVTDITGDAEIYEFELPLNGYYYAAYVDQSFEVISVKGYVTPA